MVSWSLKRKLVESMEYTDTSFMQQSVWSIEASTQVRLYCWRYYLNIYPHIYVQYWKWRCDMPTAKYKIKFSKALQNLCTAKSKNKSDTFSYKFNRNCCFNFSFKGRCWFKLFWLKLFLLKINCMHLTL